MFKGIAGDHNIADVDVGLKTAGDPCIDDDVRLKTVNKYLSTYGGINFSNTAAYNYDILPIITSLAKIH